MHCPTQTKLFPLSDSAHGGTFTQRKRKGARPICVKRSMHVVLRAKRAQGKRSLLYSPNAKRVGHYLKKYADKFDVWVYDYVNVGNHLHLSVKAKTKDGFRNFLRAFAGHVAQFVTGARPGIKEKFWDVLAYSRIVEWGRAFQIVRKYFVKNLLQAAPIGSRSLRC